VSDIFKPVGDALAALATALDVDPSVTGYFPAPGNAGLDQVPAVVIEPPAGNRSEVDGPESQFFTNDWDLVFQVNAYVDLDVAEDAQLLLADVVEAFILAIDATPDLGFGGQVLDTKVTGWTKPLVLAEENDARPLLFVEMTVELTFFVSPS
jgi:hypothetical protein